MQSRNLLLKTINLLYKVPLNIFCSKRSLQQQAYYNNRKSRLQGHKYVSFYPSITIPNFIAKYTKKISQEGQMVKEDQQNLRKEKISGRVTSIRTHGKTTFIDIRHQHRKLQLVWRKQKKQSKQNDLQINRGDIIGAQGTVFTTKMGQLSLKIEHIQILSPCYWMLPQHEALKDQQARYRERHLDFLTNPQSFNKIKTRSKIMKIFRSFLQDQGFMEVQTPVLSQSAGGAIAKPFKTYHNDYKMDMFMRIAPQLYLKRLLIGGFSKVYEIGKNFRNESVDQTHNPEFTSCQLYEAYSDYQKMQTFTQKLITQIAVQLNGTYEIKIAQKTIDISPSAWREIDFIGGLQEIMSVKFPNQFQSEQSYRFLNQICKKNNVQCENPRTAARLLDKLGQKYLQSINFPNPLVIKNHPKILSPLAKPIPQKVHLTQRFQLFINGWEIVNSYTELNDPFIQKQNTPGDIQYVEALQYGLMPCAGWGIGIDRLVMIFTGSQRIQQVITYPLLRTKNQ